MSEGSNGLTHSEQISNDVSWKLGPRDFVLKNLKYIPWIIICGTISIVLAWLNIRYSTPIFKVQSSMMINNQGNSGSKGDRFDALLMSPGSENLSNEIQILMSRPVLQRVINNIQLTTRYYNIGKVRTSLMYPESPVSLEILSPSKDPHNFGLNITILNDQQYRINKETTAHVFGEIIEVMGNKVTLVRDPRVDLRNYASPVFYISHSSAASVVNEYLGAVSITQASDQSTILVLSFQTENPELGKNFLNALMGVYDSLNIEDKNRISINSLKFINTNLDTLES